MFDRPKSILRRETVAMLTPFHRPGCRCVVAREWHWCEECGPRLGATSHPLRAHTQRCMVQEIPRGSSSSDDTHMTFNHHWIAKKSSTALDGVNVHKDVLMTVYCARQNLNKHGHDDYEIVALVGHCVSGGGYWWPFSTISALATSHVMGSEAKRGSAMRTFIILHRKCCYCS